MRAACSRPSLLLPTEEVAEGKNAILIGMSQWNSNDLVEQMETMGKLEEHQGETLLPGAPGMDMLWGGGVWASGLEPTALRTVTGLWAPPLPGPTSLQEPRGHLCRRLSFYPLPPGMHISRGRGAAVSLEGWACAVGRAG